MQVFIKNNFNPLSSTSTPPPPSSLSSSSSDNQLFVVDVPTNDLETIEQLKTYIEKKSSIKPDDQLLSIDQQPINDDALTLRHYGIKHGDTLDLDPWHVTVHETSTGKKLFSLTIHPNDTISMIQSKIIEKNQEEKISRRYVDLSYDGRKLDQPQRTVKDYGIRPGSRLDLQPITDDEDDEHELLSTTFDVDIDIVDDDVPFIQVNGGRKNHSHSLLQPPSKPHKDLVWDDDAITNCFQITTLSHDVQNFDEDRNNNNDVDNDGLDVHGSPEQQQEQQTKRLCRRATTGPSLSSSSDSRYYWTVPPPPFLNHHQHHHDHHNEKSLVVTPAFSSAPQQKLFTVQESQSIISIFKNHPIPTTTTTTTAAQPLFSTSP